MRDRISIEIHAEVDVDCAAWEREYGRGGDELVADAEDYILTALSGSAAAQAGALTVTGLAVRERVA